MIMIMSYWIIYIALRHICAMDCCCIPFNAVRIIEMLRSGSVQFGLGFYLQLLLMFIGPFSVRIITLSD